MRIPAFLLSATVDFPDDCSKIVFTEDLLAQVIDSLQGLGVRRLYWNFYQQPFWQAFAERNSATQRTLANLGDPLAVGCRLAHERGMDFYAIIKPYETGVSHSAPARSPQVAGKPGLPRIGGVCTQLDPWVLARPDLRVRGRAGDIRAGLSRIPVQRIQLRQKDMAPVRIRPENLEIWTSDDNNGYRKAEVSFAVAESVDKCPRDVVDVLGNPITRKGEPVRVLDLTGFNLTDPFIAITTNLADESGTFRNTAIEMVRAFGPDECPLPIVVASHKSTWQNPRDLRTGNLEYDCGHGDFNVCLDVTNERRICPACRERGTTDCMQGPIFPDTPICRDGVVAFARGRNAYVPGSLCEAYPEVQAYWLDWVGECLVAGVDGLDVRISNHSCWTDTPGLYGFNEPILAEYERRYGVNPDVEPYDPELIGTIRGEFYDGFLRAVKQRLAAAGKRLQLHLEVESFRPDAPQARERTRPGNIAFNWRRWLRSGLAEEATLMGVNWLPDRVLNDAVGQEMMREAADANVPVYLRHFIWTSRDGKTHADRLEYACRFAGLSGYNLYEAAAFYDNRSLGPDGKLQFFPGLLEALRERSRDLGLV